MLVISQGNQIYHLILDEYFKGDPAIIDAVVGTAVKQLEKQSSKESINFYSLRVKAHREASLSALQQIPLEKV